MHGEQKVKFTTVASPHAIRLFLQMPLREDSRTFSIFKMLTVPIYNFDLKRYVQLRTAQERTAISKDRRNFVVLDTDFSKFCREGYINCCEFRTPVYDRNYMTCSSALYYGKDGAANELCEKVVWGS